MICRQQAGLLPRQSIHASLMHRWQMALDKGDNVKAVFCDKPKQSL